MQRRAVFVIGAAANEVFGDIEGDAALGTEPVDDFADFRHDFGADAVAGQDEERWVGHDRIPCGKLR